MLLNRFHARIRIRAMLLKCTGKAFSVGHAVHLNFGVDQENNMAQNSSKKNNRSQTGSKKRIGMLLIAAIVILAVAAAGIIYSLSVRKSSLSEESSAGRSSAETSDTVDQKPDNENASASSGTDTKISLLMVDNDEDNQRVVKRFEKLGCEVTTTYDSDMVDPDQYDGLVIPGGGNVTPGMYGAERSQFTSDTDLEKDQIQIDAVKKFVAVKKPVLGICRGSQIINVAFGGTLDQGNGEYHEGWHKVRIAEGSLMYDTFEGEVDAYHYHKQQVLKLGSGLKATQWDIENPALIEGFEHVTLPVYGVQWHPDAIKMHEDGERAFQTFIDAVAKQKNR